VVQAPGSIDETIGTRQASQPYPFFQNLQMRMRSDFSTYGDGRQDPACSLWQAECAILQHSRRSSKVRHTTNSLESQSAPALLIVVLQDRKEQQGHRSSWSTPYPCLVNLALG